MQSLAPGSLIQVPEFPEGDVLEQEVPSLVEMDKSKVCGAGFDEVLPPEVEAELRDTYGAWTVPPWEL